MNSFNNNKGFSLIELMIGLLLGFLMLSILVFTVVGINENVRQQLSASRQQETARFIFDYLKRHIAAAGYSPCFDTSETEVSISSSFVPENMSDAIGLGPDNRIRGNIGGASSLTATTGSSILHLRSISNDLAHLTVNMSDKSDLISIDHLAEGLEVDHNALIADCEFAEIFRITGVTGNTLAHESTGNISDNLTHRYKTNAVLGEYRLTTIYLKNNILYEKKINIGSDEQSVIARNIESFDILYGLDTDNNSVVDSYLDADSVSDWSQLGSLNVSFRIKSDQAFPAEASFDTALVSQNEDGFLIRRYQLTIDPRNFKYE